MNQFSHTLYLYLQMVYHASIQPYIILVLTDGLPCLNSAIHILVLTDGLPCLNSAIHYTCTYRWFTMPQFSHTLYLYLQMVYHASIQPYIILVLTDGLPCLNSAIHYTCTYRWFTMPQFSHTLYLYLQMVYHASIQLYIILVLTDGLPCLNNSAIHIKCTCTYIWFTISQFGHTYTCTYISM